MMILSLIWLLAGRRIDFATEPAAKYWADTPEGMREQAEALRQPKLIFFDFQY